MQKQKQKNETTSEKTVYTQSSALPNMKNTNEHGIIAMYSELFTQLNESDSAARPQLSGGRVQ